MKRICIVGVGAVGGFIGTLLAARGCHVSAVARGETLKALQLHGLRVQMGGQLLTGPVTATLDPEELGVQDLVIVAVKAQSMNSVAAVISPLIGPETIVFSAMNGVPWWFFNGYGGSCSGLHLKAVDPGGTIAASIPDKNIIGGVVHGSFALDEPGFVRHVGGKKLIIGEPDGTLTERVQTLATLLSEAGIEIEISTAIQQDIWFKLWGNMTMNPVSAITGATCDRILDDPLVKNFCLQVMTEAAEVGSKINCPIEQSGEERNAVTRKLGAFKTSMLNDVEAGRSVELDALVAAVREIGEKVGVATPNMNILLGLARLHAQTRGLYPESRIGDEKSQS